MSDQFQLLTFEDGSEIRAPARHPLTAYTCCRCFGMIVGPRAAAQWAGCRLPPERETTG